MAWELAGDIKRHRLKAFSRTVGSFAFYRKHPKYWCVKSGVPIRWQVRIVAD
ncbi:MAG: hypothetical protein AAFQ74_16535 [Cyanobacteria bacterium J06623_4]